MNLANYKIPFNPLGILECVDLLDFQDYPILNVERDSSGHEYISYLSTYLPDNCEQRILARVTANKLLDLRLGIISVNEIFSESLAGVIFAFHLEEMTGNIIESFIIPADRFSEMNPIPADYRIYCPPVSAEYYGTERSLAVAKDRQHVIFNLYVQGKELLAGVKPWAISGIFQPFLTILQQAFRMTKQQFNEYVRFPQFQVSSFGATIEINGADLFQGELDINDYTRVINLVTARTDVDFRNLISQFRDEGFIKEYLTVLNTIRKYDLELTTTLADHINEVVSTANIDKESANEVRKVINAEFQEIIDIEDVEGVFLDVNFSVKTPSFVIETSEGDKIKGKLSDSITDRIQADNINFTTRQYIFRIKTVYQPETALRHENIQKLLLDYNPINFTIG